jgi:Ca2+-binding RTX toxin-like protein
LGNDTYVVNSTTDTITELTGQGNDTVESSVTFSINTTALQSVIENITLTGTTSGTTATGNALDNVLTGSSVANTLTGNDGHDTLNGLGGNDTLSGGNGNDILDGGTGNDGMTGGAGNDTFVVDSSSDTVTEASGGGTDTIQTSVQFTWAANVENMTLTGTGNINAPTTTSSANNIIIGNTGNNSIDGGSGNDTINGGGGTDSITGGLGADTYQYTSGGGADTINNVASDSLTDRLVFTDLASTSVTFTRTSNNLVATVAAGAGGGSVTVTNWFSATANRIDFLNFTNGEFTAAQVDAAVSGGGGLGFQAGGLETMAVPQSADPISIRSFHEIAASNLEDSSITLGGKLAADEAAGRRWMPIKTFPTDPATIGVNRLVDAMAAFGEDNEVTGDLAGSDGLQAHALESLAAHHEVTRTSRFHSEFRTVLD